MSTGQIQEILYHIINHFSDGDQKCPMKYRLNAGVNDDLDFTNEDVYVAYWNEQITSDICIKCELKPFLSVSETVKRMLCLKFDTTKYDNELLIIINSLNLGLVVDDLQKWIEESDKQQKFTVRVSVNRVVIKTSVMGHDTISTGRKMSSQITLTICVIGESSQKITTKLQPVLQAIRSVYYGNEILSPPNVAFNGTNFGQTQIAFNEFDFGKAHVMCDIPMFKVASFINNNTIESLRYVFSDLIHNVSLLETNTCLQYLFTMVNASDHYKLSILLEKCTSLTSLKLMVNLSKQQPDDLHAIITILANQKTLTTLDLTFFAPPNYVIPEQSLRIIFDTQTISQLLISLRTGHSYVPFVLDRYIGDIIANTSITELGFNKGRINVNLIPFIIDKQRDELFLMKLVVVGDKVTETLDALFILHPNNVMFANITNYCNRNSRNSRIYNTSLSKRC